MDQHSGNNKLVNEPPDPDLNEPPSRAENTASFAPGLLADLTRALLPFLGPYSITTVKRASRSCDNGTDLLRHIAGHIDDIAKREMYMKAGKRILSGNTEMLAANSHTGVSADSEKNFAEVPADGNRASVPVTAELAQRGEAALAPIIGPIASVLVSRYAKASQNSREFYDRLAGHLRTPEERDSFFLSVRTGNESWRPH